MFTDYIVEYAKQASHLVLEHTFPRNSEIVAISGGVLWLTRRGVDVETKISLQNANVKIFQTIFGENLFAWAVGKVSGWVWIPEVATFTANQVSIGCALATSFTLNMIALAIFGPKKGGKGKHSLPQILQRIGMEVNPKDEPASIKGFLEQPKAEKGDQSLKDAASNAQAAKAPAHAPGHQNSPAATHTANAGQDELDKSVDESSLENTENMFDDDPLTKDRGWCSLCC